MNPLDRRDTESRFHKISSIQDGCGRGELDWQSVSCFERLAKYETILNRAETRAATEQWMMAGIEIFSMDR